MSKLYSLLNSGSVLSLFLQVIPITLLVGVIYAIYRCVRIKRHGNTVSWGTEIMRWLFVCYLTGLVNLMSQLAESSTKRWRLADTFVFGRGVPIRNSVRPMPPS